MSDSIRHLHDVSYVQGSVRVNLRFARYGQRFDQAQQWLGNQVLTDCIPYMPLRTGSQRQRSYVAAGGAQVIFPGPYARFLYMGKVMVDSETGSPWARRDAVKVVTPRNLKLQVGVPHWAEAAKADHGGEWTRGCKRILLGR